MNTLNTNTTNNETVNFLYNYYTEKFLHKHVGIVVNVVRCDDQLFVVETNFDNKNLGALANATLTYNIEDNTIKVENRFLYTEDFNEDVFAAVDSFDEEVDLLDEAVEAFINGDFE